MLNDGHKRTGHNQYHQWIDPHLTIEEAREEANLLNLDQAQVASLASEVRKVLIELANRRIEALKLYEPLPLQNKFHLCRAPERLIRGSNRAGKTLTSCSEVARAVTGQDPYNKYPIRDGRCFIVGKDGKHISEVLYRKLFRAGAFRIIRDVVTNEWRAFRPWKKDDHLRFTESRPAPPLIPERFISEIAWENKKSNQPQVVRLHNGWEINFYSSLGKPPQGADIDISLFDEEVVDPNWWPEMAARLVDRQGKFIWSATPQAGTDQLFELSCQADHEKDLPEPRVVEFLMLLEDNAHIPDEDKKLLALKYSDPTEYSIRVKGEFALLSRLIYPEFRKGIHTTPLGEIPHSWTRYLSVDPGRQVCCVIFVAVPPPGFSKQRFVYDELYIENCTAIKFGEEMARKCSGQQFQCFLIDAHAGRIPDMGSGLTIEFQYSEQLKKHNISSLETGFGFQWGSDDAKAGISAVQTWLAIEADGEPTLKFAEGRTDKIQREIMRYHNKTVNGVVTDIPVKKHDHGPDNLRYLATHGCRYVKPPPPKKRDSYAVKAVRKKQEEARKARGRTFVSLAPGK